ncbi:YciI family protein [Pedobacter sp. SYSU D00535]|uniref:YciI family protein n=1 Tax=Pedobacter sp. SYSU D00535 TaxID=2810308 RepID=UPI001F617AFA|nr:YciI family protein [Pedobacter sp. SYSU D00535]
MYKLIPPRPTFHLDMNEEEKAVMESHILYWNGLFAERKTLVYGPVLDPKGVFGLAILEVESEEEAQQMISEDPAVTSGINQYELLPMMVGLVRQ